jgi:hypothetical protein
MTVAGAPYDSTALLETPAHALPLPTVLQQDRRLVAGRLERLPMLQVRLRTAQASEAQ